MMTSIEVLSVYEAMLALTGQLVVAASNNDWEQFMLLEQRCATHLQTLNNGDAALPMTGANRQKKIALMKNLLSDDRKIRDLTTPWMSRLAALVDRPAQNNASTRA
jgi:flagellar protein FliT